MSTVTRPELSDKNKYHLEKHRYYELKHFCLQYPIWEKTYNSIDGLSKRPDSFIFSNAISNPTENCALARQYYGERIDMIQEACKRTDESMAIYILKAVTEGRAYENLRTVYGIPCCRESYYDAYRHFFYILNSLRN